MPPIPTAMKSSGAANEVVTVTDVVANADDADAEHVDGQGWTMLRIVKLAEVAGAIPGLVATRVYPPGWLIFRSENEAIPPLAGTMTVPDSVPGLESGPMATVTSALEAAASWPDPSKTSTLTGPLWPLAREVMGAPTAVTVGCPSRVNASEHDPITVPEGSLAGSGWKSLPEPLKSFDCL